MPDKFDVMATEVLSHFGSTPWEGTNLHADIADALRAAVAEAWNDAAAMIVTEADTKWPDEDGIQSRVAHYLAMLCRERSLGKDTP